MSFTNINPPRVYTCSPSWTPIPGLVLTVASWPAYRFLRRQINESESWSLISDFLQPCGLYSPWKSPGQKTGVGSCSLLHGIIPTQGLSPGLLNCRQILYQLSHQGSPRILHGIFLTQKSNWSLLLCRWIVYLLNYQGSPSLSHPFNNFPQFVVIHTIKGFRVVNAAEVGFILFIFFFSWNPLPFSMITRMLAIWSLVPLPFLNLHWTSRCSRSHTVEA